MVLICLFDLWGELGPKINNCEATPPKKKNRGRALLLLWSQHYILLCSILESLGTSPSSRKFQGNPDLEMKCSCHLGRHDFLHVLRLHGDDQMILKDPSCVDHTLHWQIVQSFHGCSSSLDLGRRCLSIYILLYFLFTMFFFTMFYLCSIFLHAF